MMGTIGGLLFVFGLATLYWVDISIGLAMMMFGSIFYVADVLYQEYKRVKD